MIHTLIRAAIDGARKGIEEATPKARALVLRDPDLVQSALDHGRDVSLALDLDDGWIEFADGERVTLRSGTLFVGMGR